MSSKSNRKITETAVSNTRTSDNAAKLIFDDPILCAEFLRGYVDLDILKEVQPEDIEDISERFLPMWQEGRDSDSVKKVNLKGMPLFLIAIVEHQSKVYYDMAFKMLRYMVMVLTDYESEQEKLHPGITKTKDFKYPPILPVIYYEGRDKWTAVTNFQDRVYLSDILGKYIPDFEYLVVPLKSYTNEELIEKNDELSLIMLVNKLQSSDDFKKLRNIPESYFDKLNQTTPEYLLKIISKIIAVLLYKLNIPRNVVEDFTDQIERRDFAMLFDSFEAYDVQETRRISREEGLKRGLKEGRDKGREEHLVELVCKKMKKNFSVSEIAEMFEESADTIQKIYDVALEYAPEFDLDAIMAKLHQKQNPEKSC